jgi:hypothetical protein
MLGFVTKILQGKGILFKWVGIAKLQSQLEIRGEIAICGFQVPAFITVMDIWTCIQGIRLAKDGNRQQAEKEGQEIEDKP